MPALTEANDLVRARNVTASECYALLGKHPYSTPQKIFDRLTSPMNTKPDTQTEAMALGVYLEPHIARYAAKKLGVKVRGVHRTFEHPSHNLAATADYYILNTRMLIEIKVSSILYGWTEEALHPHYEYQARAQMACLDRDVVFICVLVGSTYFQIPVTRDAEKEQRLLDAVDAFWANHILPGIRPVEEPVQPGLIAVVQAAGR